MAIPNNLLSWGTCDREVATRIHTARNYPTAETVVNIDGIKTSLIASKRQINDFHAKLQSWTPQRLDCKKCRFLTFPKVRFFAFFSTILQFRTSDILQLLHWDQGGPLGNRFWLVFNSGVRGRRLQRGKNDTFPDVHL